MAHQGSSRSRKTAKQSGFGQRPVPGGCAWNFPRVAEGDVRFQCWELWTKIWHDQLGACLVQEVCARSVQVPMPVRMWVPLLTADVAGIAKELPTGEKRRPTNDKCEASLESNQNGIFAFQCLEPTHSKSVYVIRGKLGVSRFPKRHKSLKVRGKTVDLWNDATKLGAVPSNFDFLISVEDGAFLWRIW